MFNHNDYIMKKIFALMACCLAIVFTACNDDPDEPYVAPNKAFVGYYSGPITVNAVSPELGENLPFNFTVTLNADIQAGSADDKVDVVFSIDENTYETQGTVSGSNLNFGTLTYQYVEGPSVFDVNLYLTGTLSTSEKTLLSMDGTCDGSGTVLFEGMVIPLTMTGTVNGTMTKQE